MMMRDKQRVIELRCAPKGWVKPRGYRLLGWLRWEYEYELDEATASRATWDIPEWAQSPTAGIIGTWLAVRRRLVTRYGIPLGPWRIVESPRS